MLPFVRGGEHANEQGAETKEKENIVQGNGKSPCCHFPHSGVKCGSSLCKVALVVTHLMQGPWSAENKAKRQRQIDDRINQLLGTIWENKPPGHGGSWRRERMLVKHSSVSPTQRD